MKHLFIGGVVWLLSLTALAQKDIRITVFDARTKLPLAGATVTLSGGASGTTGKEGHFVFSCAGGSALTVSYVGYQAVRTVVKNCTDLSISLLPAGQSLPQVEISATSNPNKAILYQPASITRLTPLELKRGTGLFLDEAINGNVPGVSMQRRGVSSGQQFNIRGYGNGSRGTRGVSSNFDGQGYKVYLNGIPVTDAEGITTMDDLDFGTIGEVEISKGPSGTLYGLAIAGVVNLNTVRPKANTTSIAQEVLAGNYGLYRYNTRFQSASDKASILLNYGHQSADGYTVHNGSRKDFLNASATFIVSPKESVNTYFGYSNSYDERSGELTITQYNNNDYSGNIDYLKRNGHSAVNTVRAGLGHSYYFNSHISNTTTLFATGFSSNASSAAGWTDKLSINLGLRSTFDTKFSFGKKVLLSGITGVETQRQNAQTVGYTMLKNPQDTSSVWTYGNPLYWIVGASTSNVYAASSTTSVFSEWTVSLPRDFSVTAGIGFSNMIIGLKDRFYVASTPNRTRQYDTAYGRMVSPHVALNKVFSKQFSVYGSYSRAYKAPVSSYFYIPYSVTGTSQSGIVNKNLQPEVGDQFELGTKGALLNGKLSYQLALFDAIFSHKMTTVAVPYNNTTTLFSYVVNGGKQDDKGIEALIKYTLYGSANGFIRALTPFANVTYSDFRYTDYRFQTIGKTVSAPVKDSALTTDYSGHRVAGVAKWVANAGIDLLTNTGIYGNVNLYYKDGMPITSDGLFSTGSYSLLNAKLGYQGVIKNHIDYDVYFGTSNLANNRYPLAVFVNQLPDAYLAGPPTAAFFGGFNLAYHF